MLAVMAVVVVFAVRTGNGNAFVIEHQLPEVVAAFEDRNASLAGSLYFGVAVGNGRGAYHQIGADHILCVVADGDACTIADEGPVLQEKARGPTP